MPSHPDSASPKQETCLCLIRTSPSVKKEKSSADQGQRLRSCTSPQHVPKINRPGPPSLFSANLFGPFD